jgi:hypothetical protein
MIKNILLSLATVFLLTACATGWDVDLAKENTSRINSHSKAQSEQVKYRSKAVADVAASYKCADEGSADCAAVQAMMRYRGFEALEGITTVEYRGHSEKTGVDIQHELAKDADRILLYTVDPLLSLLDGQEEPDSVELNGDNNTVTFEETHATAIRDSNATVDKSQIEDNSSE